MSERRLYSVKVSNRDRFKEFLEEKGIYCRLQSDGVLVWKMEGWSFNNTVDAEGNLMYDNWGAPAKSMEQLGEVLQDFNEQEVLRDAHMWHTDLEDGYSANVSNVSMQQLENGDREVLVHYDIV